LKYSEIIELNTKISELELEKSKTGGDVEKNTTKQKKSLADYLMCIKNNNMEEKNENKSELNMDSNINTCPKKEAQSESIIEPVDTQNSKPLVITKKNEAVQSTTGSTENIIPISGGIVESISDNGDIGPMIAWSALIILLIIVLFLIFGWGKQKKNERTLHSLPIIP